MAEDDRIRARMTLDGSFTGREGSAVPPLDGRVFITVIGCRGGDVAATAVHLSARDTMEAHCVGCTNSPSLRLTPLRAIKEAICCQLAPSSRKSVKRATCRRSTRSSGFGPREPDRSFIKASIRASVSFVSMMCFTTASLSLQRYRTFQNVFSTPVHPLVPPTKNLKLRINVHVFPWRGT